jgi:hypothetical protein
MGRKHSRDFRHGRACRDILAGDRQNTTVLPSRPSSVAARAPRAYPGGMEVSDAELAWIVDRLVTLEQQIRAPKGQTGFPKSTIASTLKGTSPPERIRKILETVK